MAFRFDPYAVLAEIQKSTAHPATLPILPTLGPDGGETVGRIGTIERARRQNRAALDLDAFAERAAISEHDGGLSCAAAETLAAEAQGFPDPAAVYCTAATQWLAELDALERRDGRRRQIDRARAFVSGGWAAQALALGWDELSLFGLCPAAPWQRLDRMGAAWFGDARAVTSKAVTYQTGNRLLRLHQAPGAVLLWGAG